MMYANISEINSPNFGARFEEEYKKISPNSELLNFYIYSDDDFARKIVSEIKNTTLNLLAEIKGMSVPQFCDYLTSSLSYSFDSVSKAFIGSIFNLKEKKIPSEFIANELKTSTEKIDKIASKARILLLAEQIENEEIVKEIEERAVKYGGIEAMLSTRGIPADEVYRELGIADVDLSEIEDVEIE